jgi:hypothetical protein
MPAPDACQRINKTIFFIPGERMKRIKPASARLDARRHGAAGATSGALRNTCKRLPRFEIEGVES